MTIDRGKKRTNLEQMILILGHPLAHSLSPVMHNAAFRRLKIPWIYLPMDLEFGFLKPFLKRMKDMPIRGANVTVPLKEAVLEGLDSVDSASKCLGSVNTIYRSGNKLIGTSTDGEGFLRSLGRLANNLFRSSGLVLGSGGAGRAVAFALASRGISNIWIANRSPGRAQDLVKILGKRFPGVSAQTISFSEGQKLLTRCDWVVQATSLGLNKGEKSPISLEGVRPSAWVVDLIYHRETSFIKEARNRRVRANDGLGMLLHQGVLSFEYWTGQKAPAREMLRCLLKHRTLKV